MYQYLNSAISMVIKHIIDNKLSVEKGIISFLHRSNQLILLALSINASHFKQYSEDIVRDDIQVIHNLKNIKYAKNTSSFSERLERTTHYLSVFFY